MKTHVGAIALVAAVLSTAVPAAALETVLNDPLKVTTCEPEFYTGMPTYVGIAPYYPHFPYWQYTMNYPWNGFWYNPPVMLTSSATLTVNYSNQTQKVMKNIRFGLIANGMLVAEVRDVGTFSPGIEIKHDLPLSTNVFPIQTALPLCLPLEITFDDGSTWMNPSSTNLRRQTIEPALVPETEPEPRVSPSAARTVRS